MKIKNIEDAKKNIEEVIEFLEEEFKERENTKVYYLINILNNVIGYQNAFIVSLKDLEKVEKSL